MNSFDVSAGSRVAAVAPPQTATAAYLLWITTAAAILVAALPLLVTPWGPDAYSGPKVLALYGLTAALLAGWFVMLAATRWPTWQPATVEVAVWAFVLAVLLSSLTSVNARLTFFGAPGRHEGLLAILTYVALFFVGMQFFGSRKVLSGLITAVCGGAAVAVAYGLVQLVIPAPFPGEAVIREWYASIGLPRVFSTLGNPVIFGAYLSLVIPLLLSMSVVTTGRAHWLWLGSVGLSYVAVAATLTRGAWLGVAVGTLIFFGTLGRAVRAPRSLWLSVAVGIALAAAVLMVAVATPVELADRVASSLSVQAGSGAQRVYIWTQTIKLIRARPWLGWGLETLREVFPYDRAAMVQYFGLRPVIIDKAHNDVLQVAVSVGIPGAVMYVAMWIAVLIAAARRWWCETGDGRILAAGCLAGVSAYLIQAQFSFSTVAVAPIAWLLAGAVIGWDSAAIGAGHGQ